MKKVISVILTVIMLTVAVFAAAGDVNSDGELNNKDVVALFRYVSGNKSAVKDESACDYNGDGEVDNKDVVTLFKAVSGTPAPVFEEPFYYPGNEVENDFNFEGDKAEGFRGIYFVINRNTAHISPGERFQVRFAAYHWRDIRVSVKDVDLQITKGAEHAVLDNRGVFTAKSVGDVEITATLKADPTKTAKRTINITEPKEKNKMWKGSGTFRDPYLVSTAQDFLNIQKISKHVEGLSEMDTCWFKQTNDIDFTGVDFEPGFFTHNYDGNGYKLKNITVDETVDRCGSTFGFTYYCVIKNVTVENFRYERHDTISAWEAAVFFGNTRGMTAYNCHAVNAYIDITGNTNQTGCAGGFLAHEVFGSSYVNCSTDAVVKGDYDVGGFYGTTEAYEGVFVNCKATGTAEAVLYTDRCGGFTSQQISYLTAIQFYNCSSAQYDQTLEVNNIVTE